MITCIIKTIGRSTLDRAVTSACKEFDEVIVVSDGVINEHTKHVDTKNSCSQYGLSLSRGIIDLPQQYGHYGSMAANVGAIMSKNPYICFLDDDDEFIEGAGDYMRQSVASKPEVDIWFAGIRFQDGLELAVHRKNGLVPGNVAMPTYRKEIITKVPFSHDVPEEAANYTDLYHVNKAILAGYNKVAWYEKVLYNVRPRLEGRNGRGK